MNRDGRDDEDHSPPRWAVPPARDSVTRVGIGPEHRGARNGDTPPSPQSYDVHGDLSRDNGDGPPTPRDPVTEHLAHGDVSLILSQINAQGGKVDACISDVREIKKDFRTFVEAQKGRDEALFALLPIPARTAALEGLVGMPSREEPTAKGFKIIPATGLLADIESLRAKQAGRDSNAVIVERLADTAVDGQRADIERKRVVTAWVRQAGTWVTVAGGGAGAVTFKAQPYVAVVVALVAVLLAILISGARKK